jgi:hypothetical protein
MSIELLLLGAQAAGFGLNLFQNRKKEQFSNYGADIEHDELSLQMEKEQLSSTEDAYANQERLREVMASQRALFAARGQKVGQGTAVSFAQREIRTHSYDERARQVSMSYRKHQLESQQRLIKLNKHAKKSQRQTKDFMSGLNLLNFNNLSGFGSKLGG